MTEQEEKRLHLIEAGYKAGIYFFQTHWKELTEGPLVPPNLSQRYMTSSNLKMTLC